MTQQLFPVPAQPNPARRFVVALALVWSRVYWKLGIPRAAMPSAWSVYVVAVQVGQLKLK